MSMRKVQPQKMASMAKMSEKAMYPMVCLDNEVLPEAKDWKVGKVYEVTMRLKMQSTSMREDMEGEMDGNYSFDVVGIDPGQEIKGKNTRYVD